MDKRSIIAICIDDFAIRKRFSYGTVMVNIETGRIVDLLESRDAKDVSSWLAEYPNIKYVSRDGSHTYASAITLAHPDACQISDRFHIVKNLNEAIVLHFIKIFKGRIEIPLTAKTAEIKRTILYAPTQRERIVLVKSLFSEGKTRDEIKCITECSKQTITKYIRMKDEDIPPEKLTDSRGKLHNEAIEKVQAKADLCRDLQAEGYCIDRISKRTGLTRNTVTKYLSLDFTPVNGHYGNRRRGLLSSYRDEVIHLRSEGKTYTEIAEIIRDRGYTGTVDALRGFIAKEKRLHKDLKDSSGSGPVELVERKWLIQLLFRPMVSVKGITEEQFDLIIEKYPMAGKLYEAARWFKEIMFSKKSEGLIQWMQYVETLEISELNSFINGLKNDITAVKNSIDLEYNNGLAEGSINKIKVIKRIMYGRNKFDLLRNKVLLLESRKIN